LIFSGSLITIEMIEHFLETKGVKNQPGDFWDLGTDYQILTGATSSEDRLRMCDKYVLVYH